MLFFLICLAVAVLPAAGAPPEVSPVAVFTHFEEPSSAAVLGSMEQEVDAIMAPLGFPLTWKSLDNLSGSDVTVSLAIVTFLGTCGINNLPAARWFGPLGLTHVSDGVVIPFTDIDCDSIRNFLRKDLLRIPPASRDAQFGRAIGRVLAHELFHVFAMTMHHGSRGVGKPVFSQGELTAPHFQFETSELRVLRSSLKQARLLNRRIRPAASPVTGRFIFQENGCAKCHGKSGRGTKAGPRLRLAGKVADLPAMLSRNAPRMSSRAKANGISADPLDEDEVADVASFLGSLSPAQDKTGP